MWLHRRTVNEFYASLAAFRMHCIDLVVIICVLCFQKISMMMVVVSALDYCKRLCVNSTLVSVQCGIGVRVLTLLCAVLRDVASPG